MTTTQSQGLTTQSQGLTTVSGATTQSPDLTAVSGTTINPLGEYEPAMVGDTVGDSIDGKRLPIYGTAKTIIGDEFRKDVSFHSKDNKKDDGCSNGFVDIKDNENNVPFSLFQVGEKKQGFKESLEGIIQSSILSEVFFSRKNINNIQNNIIEKVFKGSNSNYLIDKQSEKELQIIMRSIYLQNALNNDTEIQLQIKNLNNLVYDYCVPNILVNATQYIGYLKDIDTVPKSIPGPVSDKITGNKKCYKLPDSLF